MFGRLAGLLFIIIFLTLAACASPGQVSISPGSTVNTGQVSMQPVSNTPGLTTPAPPDTQFGHMLGLVPYSFLAKHDVWFGDQKAATDVYRIQDINSQEALMQLTPDQRKQVATALQGIAGVFTSNNWQKLAPITGYDVWSVDRSIFVDTPPPWAFYVSEGTFNKDVIIGKLTDLGYQKVDYGSYSYYSINDDFSFGNLSSTIAQQVLAAMNRMAILDGTAIIAPATDIMTGIMDTLAGKTVAVIDDPVGRALARSLGDILSGVIMNPERTLNMNPPQTMPPFNFTVPSDWGLLHRYEMTGIGFKNDGKDRYWVISLYYNDAKDATADADILVGRMQSYILNTQFEQTPGQSFKPVPLTDKFDVREPLVQTYPGENNPAATLTIECRYKPDTSAGYWLIPITSFRDLLFLAPDPTPYIK